MQQFSFTDLFIGLFESALYFSGDKPAHFQEHFWLYLQSKVLLKIVEFVNVTGRQHYRCIVPKL